MLRVACNFGINLLFYGEDGEVEEEMPLPNFMSFAREEVTILNKNVKKLKKVTGTANLTKEEYDKYSSKVVGKVPAVVTAEEIAYDVKLPDGRILKQFPSAGLNR